MKSLRQSVRFKRVLLVPALLLIAALIGCGSSNSSSTSSTNPGSTGTSAGGAPPPSSGGTSTGAGTGTSGGTSGGSSGSGTSSGSSGNPTSGNAPRFVYALDATQVGNSSIAAFSINASTGVLTPLSPANTPTSPFGAAMAATPRTGYLYVGDWKNKEIIIYRADATSGVLTQISTMANPNLQYPSWMLVSPNNQTLYISDANGFQIWAYTIANDGSLSAVPGSPFKISDSPTYLSMDASSHFLFVSGSNNLVFGFTVSNNGALTPTAGSPTTVRALSNSPGKGPQGVMAAIDPDARFLYVLDQFNAVIYVYTVSGTGMLTAVPGSPFQEGGVHARVLAAHSKFVFAPDATVAALDVNQSSGALTPAPGSPVDNGPFRSGGSPVNDDKIDPSGKFLLLSDTDQGKITVFSIDQSTGALTNVQGSPFTVSSGSGSPQTIQITY